MALRGEGVLKAERIQTDNEGCGKIASIVTVIAGLIAIFVFVTGKQNLPQVVQENQSKPMQVSITSAPTTSSTATAVPTTVPSTKIPIPRPSETPSPLPTINSDTPPGTILDVGETWIQGGILFTIVSTNISGNDIYVRFIWSNNTDNTIVTQINERTLRLVANNNVEIGISGHWLSGSTSVNPGAERQDEYRYSGNLANPSITQIIAIVNVSRITNARWRIPIYH